MKKQVSSVSNRQHAISDNTLKIKQQGKKCGSKKTFPGMFSAFAIGFLLLVFSGSLNAQTFTANAGSIQYQTRPFTISITDAEDAFSDPLNGDYDVVVESVDGSGYQAEGEIFNGSVTFFAGEADVEVELNLAGKHSLEVTIATINNVTLSDIDVFDFSSFSIDEPIADQYADKPFTISLNSAFDVTGALLNGKKNVVITSNQESEVVFDGSVDGSVEFISGNAEVTITLTEGSTPTLTTHTLAVSIEDIIDSETTTVDVDENDATFTATLLDPADDGTITAGQPFSIDITSATDADESTLPDGNYTIEVTSSLADQPEIHTQTINLTSGASGSDDININTPADNETGDETVFKPGTHTLTIKIVETGATVTKNLTVEAGTGTKLKIVDQPTGNTGSFDDAATNISTAVINLTIVDEFGNLNTSSIAGQQIYAIIETPDPTDAVLTGSNIGTTPGAQDESNFGVFWNGSNFVFSDLNLNKNGTYTIKFYEKTESFAEVVSDEFEMSSIEDLSDIQIVDPGPQIKDEPFNMTIKNIKSNDGSEVNESRNVQIRNITNARNLYNASASISDGQVTISGISFTNAVFDTKDVQVTVENIPAENIDIKLEGSNQSDGFNAVLNPSGNPSSGKPFDIDITSAEDASNVSLTDKHLVTVSSDVEGTLFNDTLVFASGGVTIPGVVLTTTGAQELTVSIDWVKTEQTINVTVAEGIIVEDENNNDLNGATLDLGTLTSGYSSAQADALEQTITINRSGADVTINEIEISGDDPSSFVGGSLLTFALNDDETLTETDSSYDFTLKPATDLGVREHSATVTITYSNTETITFDVLFEVEDSYEIKIEDSSSPANELDESNPFVFSSEEEDDYSGITETITITNDGSGSPTINTITLSGPNASDFELTGTDITNLPITIDGNTETEITFTVGPDNSLSVGTYEATVNISGDNNISEQFDVTFTVTAGALDITLSPSGSTFLGMLSFDYDPNNAQQTITITNTGNADIDSYTVTSDGSDYDIDFTTEEILRGNTSSFTIRPDPGLSEDSYSETITVTATDDDGDNGNAQTHEATITVTFLVDAIEWTGDLNTSWNETGNWAPQSVNGGAWPTGIDPQRPNRFVEIIIPNVTRDPVLSTNPDIITQSITIENDATLTIQDGRVLTIQDGDGPNSIDDATGGTESGKLIINGSMVNNDATGGLSVAGTLDVNGDLTNNGALTSTGVLNVNETGRLTSTTGATLTSANVTNLVVHADAPADDNTANNGSIIVENTSNTGVQATVQRWLENSTWHLISTPVIGYGITDFVNDNKILWNENYLGGVYAFRDYNESDDTWNWYDDGNNSTYPDLPTTEMEHGKSYLVATTDGAAAISFKGEIPVADKTITLSRTSGVDLGWNAIGNPFPSSVALSDAALGILTTPNLDNLDPNYGAVYVYDGSRAFGNRYIPITNATGTNHLTIGQGFFVKAKEDNSPITIETNMQAHETGAYYKDAWQNPWHRFRLTASSDNNESKAVIAFREDMTNQMDVGYDAGAYVDNPDFHLYTFMAGGDSDKKLAVQALPSTDFANTVIPVGMSIEEGRNVTFSITDAELPWYLKPVLNDTENDTLTDLTLNNYATTISENKDDRFVLNMLDVREMFAVHFNPAIKGGKMEVIANGLNKINGDKVWKGDDLFITTTPPKGYKVENWLVNGEMIAPQEKNHLLLLENVNQDTYIDVDYVPDSEFNWNASEDEQQNEELFEENQWKIFVANDQIVIFGDVNDESYAVLYDIHGKAILTTNLNDLEMNKISINGLAKGPYMLHIIEGVDRVRTEKIMIR